MATLNPLDDLKASLRKDTARFLTSDALWRQPVVQFVDDLETLQWKSVLFGGSVRDILFNRLYRQKQHGSNRAPSHLSDVVSNAECIAERARIVDSDYLRLAALLHDIGHQLAFSDEHFLLSCIQTSRGKNHSKYAHAQNVSRTVSDLLERLQQETISGACAHTGEEHTLNPEENLLRCLSRLALVNQNERRIPRDIDIVVSNIKTQEIEDHIGFLTARLNRRTRFGGFQLERQNWCFDIWPLDKTLYFTQNKGVIPSFEELPNTTFLNIEAVAIETWTKPGRERRLYDGEGQFFNGMLDRIVEVNNPSTPFVALNIVRALVFVFKTRFSVGSRLARMVASAGEELTVASIANIERQHYGNLEVAPSLIHSMVQYISDHASDKGNKIDLMPWFGSSTDWKMSCGTF